MGIKITLPQDKFEFFLAARIMLERFSALIQMNLNSINQVLSSKYSETIRVELCMSDMLMSSGMQISSGHEGVRENRKWRTWSWESTFLRGETLNYIIA